MAEFTLKIRRYDPESGGAPYWQEHTIDLEPHRSVLEGVLQAKARFDGSIGIRCSCRAADRGAAGAADADRAVVPVAGLEDAVQDGAVAVQVDREVVPIGRLAGFGRVPADSQRVFGHGISTSAPAARSG